MRRRVVGTCGLGACAVTFGLGAGRLPWPFPEPTPEPVPVPALAAPKRPVPTPVRLLAVGDLMLGTNVKQLILARGPEFPFRKHRSLLRGADLTFGNLETPLSDGGAATPGKSAESLRNRTNFIFRAPPACAAGLADAGFDVLSIANNHTMDYGAAALRDTVEALRAEGIAHVGGGANLAAAAAPVILERNGQKLALLAVSDILPLYSVADKDSPGVAPARGPGFDKQMPAAIAALRKRADWVLVSVHWGRERFTGATARQRALGHKLIDWGADVVIGHHTHCLGPVERYKNRLIHYSLGNFVSHTGYRGNVGVWQVTFRPDGRLGEERLTFGWDGESLDGSKRVAKVVRER